ncbi:hypothetical protein I4F81_011316 [Pyropia yezoensis]|uniref:Uncharacterized protein n=1 Tax=Pyropia yezoensis TaxID=2788 RepID=A0ACC3CEW8_PYRYE|nr:hypothetical protein I4F81_011316 [Neopyropia yezoensis]
MDHESTGLTPMTPAALARLAADADVGVVLAGAATPAPVAVAVPPPPPAGGGGISGGTPPPYGHTPSAPIPVPARGGGRSAPVAIPRPGGAAAAVAAAAPGAVSGGDVAVGDPMALMADVAAACGAAVAGGAGGDAAAMDAAAVVAAGSVGGAAAGGAAGGPAGVAASSAPAAFSMLTASPGIDDEHVTVWEPATGKTVAGNAAPYRRNLSTWLLTHDGWEEKADELKSSKRRSAARRAKAAAASFSNLSPLSSSVPTGNDFLGGLAGGFRTAREPRVTVWEPATGRTLSGNAAPCRRNLGAWMTSHPGWLPKAEEQLSSSRRARNRKSFLGAGGLLLPMGSLGGSVDGGGGRSGYPQLPSAVALDAAELGPSLTPLSPALSDALEGLLLMSGSSPGAVPIAGSRGGGGGGHLAASLGGGSQLGVSVGGPSSVGGVVEAMVHMSVAVEGVVGARHERVVCGKRATPSSCSDRTDRSSGFTEESAADTAPSADAMDDASAADGGTAGEGRGWDHGGKKAQPTEPPRRSKRVSAASMSMDMEL